MSVEAPHPIDLLEDRRPNVAGDLTDVLHAGPMFRRSVVGYDRFQVDTYVQWAEDELATAGREHEHLLSRHVRTQAALEDARRLLAHSPGGAELLQVSGQVGSLLAVAADEAAAMRAEAEADLAAASAQAEQLVADAERAVTEAAVQAERIVSEATDDAVALVVEAERVGAEARAEADARLAKVSATERRSAQQIEELRRRAVEDAVAARDQARDDVVRLLSTGREQRRRADAAAEATRERQDRDAATRRAALLADVAALEQRRSVLQAEVEQLAAEVRRPRSSVLEEIVRRLHERLRSRPRFLRAR